MKKLILLVMCLFLCNISTNAKTINIKGDNLLKQCNIKVKKTKSADGSKFYNCYVNAKIEGKLVDINNKPIINQTIYIKLNDNNTLKPVATISSNEKGTFQYEMNEKYDTYSKDIDLEILLQFNEKSIEELKTSFQSGNDFSINNPYEISIQLDKEQENSLYLFTNEIRTKSDIRYNKDIIILSSKTFSAQYYRDEIKKNAAINKATEMLKNARITVQVNIIENIILDKNEKLKENWKDIVNCLIEADTMFKKENLNFHITTISGIILDEDKNLKKNWKTLVKQEIQQEHHNKRNSTEEEIEKFKHDPNLHTVQSQISRCPKCYRFSLIISLLMRTGDPYHQWILFGCTECGYVEQKFNGF